MALKNTLSAHRPRRSADGTSMPIEAPERLLGGSARGRRETLLDGLGESV